LPARAKHDAQNKDLVVERLRRRIQNGLDSTTNTFQRIIARRTDVETHAERLGNSRLNETANILIRLKDV
jgi:hypothetical protein